MCDLLGNLEILDVTSLHASILAGLGSDTSTGPQCLLPQKQLVETSSIF